jgi:uncharacterized protein Smg (DUF494 family)
MSNYLENYLESISTLPQEIKRNFELMRDLDDKSQELIEKIERFTTTYSQANARNAREYSKDTVRQIREDLQTCIQYADEKVNLAVQTYDLVDKHIRRLDQDLRKFEAELESERQALGITATPPVENIDKKNLAETNIAQPTVPGTEGLPRTHPLFDPDMPIDPNEPTYCICGRVSFGEMIGCDNPECPIEWFHFECVGLQAPVKGKWYCPLCSVKLKKQKQKKHT